MGLLSNLCVLAITGKKVGCCCLVFVTLRVSFEPFCKLFVFECFECLGLAELGNYYKFSRKWSIIRGAEGSL